MAKVGNKGGFPKQILDQTPTPMKRNCPTLPKFPKADQFGIDTSYKDNQYLVKTLVN
jgi:hypothetical protein